MIPKKFIFYGIVIFLVLLVFLPIFTKGGGFEGILPDEVLSQKVECDVTVKNNAFNKVTIEGSSCNVVESCIKPLSAFNLNVASWFGAFDEGTLVLETSDGKAEISYSIGEGGSRNLPLSLCTNMDTGTLKTIAENGDITSSVVKYW